MNIEYKKTTWDTVTPILCVLAASAILLVSVMLIITSINLNLHFEDGWQQGRTLAMSKVAPEDLAAAEAFADNIQSRCLGSITPRKLFPTRELKAMAAWQGKETWLECYSTQLVPLKAVDRAIYDRFSVEHLRTYAKDKPWRDTLP